MSHLLLPRQKQVGQGTGIWPAPVKGQIPLCYGGNNMNGEIENGHMRDSTTTAVKKNVTVTLYRSHDAVGRECFYWSLARIDRGKLRKSFTPENLFDLVEVIHVLPKSFCHISNLAEP